MKKFYKMACAILILAALAVLPFVLVFVISFGQNEDGAAWHWAFVFENYQRFFVGLEFPETFSTLYLERLWNSFLYSILGALIAVALAFPFRSEERRVGKECRSRWSP